MPVLTLCDAPLATPLTLAGSEMSGSLARRLAELGLRRGARVHVTQRTSGGGRIVAVAGSRLALDKHVCRSLFAEPTADRAPGAAQAPAAAQAATGRRAVVGVAG